MDEGVVFSVWNRGRNGSWFDFDYFASSCNIFQDLMTWVLQELSKVAILVMDDDQDHHRLLRTNNNKLFSGFSTAEVNFLKLSSFCKWTDRGNGENGESTKGIRGTSRSEGLQVFGKRIQASHKARVASDFSLFSAFDQALHQAGIWLCGECFCTHTFSKNCKHVDGDVLLAPSFDEVAIYGIPVPLRPISNMVNGVAVELASTLATVEDVVEGTTSVMHSRSVEPTCFDIDLLSRVFSKKLRTVKCIPPRLRLGFAKIFRSALDKVLACPGDLSVWVQLLILPCCVLTTFVPINKAQRRSSERERCQFESISRAILRWRDPADRFVLVMDRLAGMEKMERVLKESGEHLDRKAFKYLAKGFNRSAGRAGKPAIKWTDVQSWFHDRQEGLLSKDTSLNGPNNLSGAQEVCALKNGNEVSDTSKGEKGIDLSKLEFEAKSSYDNAWYDVETFITHRFLSSGGPEVLVRYVGFGDDEDEWVHVKNVRERSVPLEHSECNRVMVGDTVLCFQEKPDQARYYDAQVIDIQRKLHDIRGCRCVFLVQYEHDKTEESVRLKRLCMSPRILEATSLIL
ncbi:Chromo domain-like protein [Artemisia annua]|uniref:Chromo domain-like protein n=1 Tax=Artemisia annua TaxID=35608 RepID=A0A2U1PA91_ARTAN|nr:Chromo domain-like protein [Artemisia annua]